MQEADRGTLPQVFRALADAETKFDATTEPLCFYQNVSPSKELRDTSNDAEGLCREFGVTSSMRLDVFQAKAAAEKNLKSSGEYDKLSPEDKRLVDKMVLDGKRAGLALPEDKRDALMSLKKELSQTCLQFSVRHHHSGRLFTASDIPRRKT